MAPKPTHAPSKHAGFAPGHVMPLGDHLEELRKRVVLALVGLAPILVVGLVFGQDALALLTGPISRALRDADLPGTLIQTSPLETFSAYIRVVLLLTILVGFPWALYQLWLFIAPGLLARERRFVYLLAPLSVTLSVLSAVFVYAVMLPVTLSFFIAFSLAVQPSHAREPGTLAPEDFPPAVLAGEAWPSVPVLPADPPEPAVGDVWVNARLNQLRVLVESGRVLNIPMQTDTFIRQEYRVSEYLGFVLTMALAFAVGFQTPVVVLLLGWIGIVQPGALAKARRVVAMVCAVAGALLTPADPLSMVLLAIPLYVLFEFGLLLLRVLPASRVAGGEPADADDHDASPFDD